jgi:hypothetical protein
MAKLEAQYKLDMVKAVKAAGGYARRVEDQFAVGTLDLMFCLPETGMFVAEAKRFTGNKFALSPRQYVEAKRVIDAGGFSASIGIRLTSPERIFIRGLPLDKSGVVRVEDCLAQQPGETFVDLLKRWHGEENGRRLEAAAQRAQHPSQRGDDHNDAEGEPTWRSGRQLPDDWQFVE